MNRARFSFLAGFLLALVVGAGLLAAAPAWAQQAGTDITGIRAFTEAAGFTSQPPLPVIIGRLIRTVIGFLGIVVVGIVIYGGFLYMTAGGDLERVKTAKRLLRNAVIGLVLILSSFAIASFIISRLTDALGVGTIGTDPPPGCPLCDGINPPGAHFALDGWNEQCSGILQNTQLQFAFTQAVRASTVTDPSRPGIVIRDPAGNAVPGTFNVRGKTVTFIPEQVCEGAPTERCFAPDTTYNVVFNPTVLRSSTNRTFECGGLLAPCVLSFRSGSQVDASPPAAAMTMPDVSGVTVPYPERVGLQVEAADDVGASMALFYVERNADPVYAAVTDTLMPLTQFSTDNIEWDTSPYVPRGYDVFAEVLDCAGHETTTAAVRVNLVPAHCANNIQDGDETGLDCGGSCGACAGGACTASWQCGNGLSCMDGTCVSTPRIDRVLPGDGAPANLITIFGVGFGEEAGTVVFLGDPDDPSDDVVVPSFTSPQCDATWLPRQVIVQVPDAAVSGPLEVRAAAYATDPTKADRTDNDFGPRISDFNVNDVVRPGLCAVTPAAGLGGITTQLAGVNFGASRGLSTVYFTSYLAAAYGAWSPTSAQVTVPRLDPRGYDVQLFTGGWFCQGTTTACTPDNNTCGEGIACVSARQGSNPVAFTVPLQSQETPPRIVSVDTGWRACQEGGGHCVVDADCAGEGNACVDTPTWGPAGQYVTISGTNFGANGWAYFSRTVEGVSQEALADVDFPAACGAATWNDTTAVVKVPAQFTDGTTVSPGTYSLRVRRGDAYSEAVAFEVVPGQPGPGICRLDPAAGPVGGENPIQVTAYGEYLNVGDSTLVFHDGAIVTSPVRTSSEELSGFAPASTQTGPVVVRRTVDNSAAPDSFQSNAMTFEVGNCRLGTLACGNGTQCCANGSCSAACEDPKTSHYAYRFSTGHIPKAPRVVVACNDEDTIASPSPWAGWSQPASVCPEAVVTATFTVEMDQTFTDDEHVEVRACTGPTENPCATFAAPESGRVSFMSSTMFEWEKVNDDGAAVPLEPGTTYRVTLRAEGFRSASRMEGGVEFGEEEMEQDFSWEFTTSASGEPCQIGGLMLQPNPFTATEPGQRVTYRALPTSATDRCVVLQCQPGYEMDWSVNKSEVSEHEAQATGGSQVLACSRVFRADEPILTDPPEAEITATLTNVGNNPSATARLIVDFADPKVVEHWPACDAACINAQIGARFNVSMVPSDFMADDTVWMYECSTATCLDDSEWSPFSLLTSGTTVKYEGGADDPKELVIQGLAGRLESNTYYRVVISGSVKSNWGTPLSDSYGGADYTWVFRTNNTGQACVPDSVAVSPANARASYVGQRQTFRATPHGAPDACSPGGQRLDASGLTWEPWTSENENVAKLFSTTVGDAFTTPASIELYPGAALPAHCTAQCLFAGARFRVGQPQCGNGGALEAGEECEVGQAGCNLDRCLWAGTPVGGVCGNGVLDPGEHPLCDGSTIGEGNTPSFCSQTTCLLIRNPATIHSAYQAGFCGNGTLEALAGELCDPQAAPWVDWPGSCTNDCRLGGSVPLMAGAAVCGDGEDNGTLYGTPNTDAGEECDFGSELNEEKGCNPVSCLWTGSNAALCGNGEVDPGEDPYCETEAGRPYCTSSCRLAGSSGLYDAPSWCGDGLVGSGEQCDVDTSSGATKVTQPFTVGRIEETAPAQVDVNSGEAKTEITAAVGNASGSADWTLTCSCTTDGDCVGAGVDLACGVGSCCAERPKLESAYQPALTENVCRNTAIWVKFNTAMNTGSLAANVRLELLPSASGGTVPTAACEAAGGTLAVAGTSGGNGPVGFFARLIDGVRSFFFPGQARAQEGGTPRCFIPVRVSASADGTVSLGLQGLLAAGARYRVVVAGDANEWDGIKTGVLGSNLTTLDASGSLFGVEGSGLASNEIAAVPSFTVGDEVCVINRITVTDEGKLNMDVVPPAEPAVVVPPENPSPRFFTRTGETHRLSAVTYATNDQEIQGIPDVYDWRWEWDDINDIIEVAASEEEWTNAVAGTEDGIETAFATAVVTAAPAGENMPAVGDETVGDITLEALLCSNPASIMDPESGHLPTHTNFTFSYCRDAGDPTITSDDLPDLVADQAPESPVGAYAEHLFPLEGTPDALGVRVFENDGYLTPEAWYAARGFSGSPQATTVDGYRALRDANTWYVFAPNLVGGTLYPNIYVISYNPGASPQSQEAFNRIVDSWRFNANQQDVTDYNICRADGGAYPKNADGNYVACSWNADCIDRCVAGACAVSGTACTTDAQCGGAGYQDLYCDAQKAKIRRDTQRLQDVVRMADIVNVRGTPVPLLEQGTFVRTLSVSAWPSWSAALGNALGAALPQDPVNDFYRCQVEGYDPDTCFNANSSRFQCPAGSHVYSFQALQGGDRYKITAQLEYDGAAWNAPIPAASLSHVDIEVGNAHGSATAGGFTPGLGFCANTVVGGSVVCGDGVKGEGELCELGEFKVGGESCSVDGVSGYYNVPCVNDGGTCRWADTVADSTFVPACVPFRCGNGLVEAGEQCDEGARNGTYGSRCNTQCQYYDSTIVTAGTLPVEFGVHFCGDGYLSGGEQCDCGNTELFSALPGTSWAKTNGRCTVANGQYADTGVACSTSCTLAGPRCGDGIVQVDNGEQCEPGQVEVATRFCSGHSHLACSSDDECPTRTVFLLGSCINNVCFGGSTPGKECTTSIGCGSGMTQQPGLCSPPTSSRICEAGNIGETCSSDAQCGPGGRCSVGVYPLQRTRTCIAPPATDACTFPDSWGPLHVANAAVCGNGIIEGTEQCDDGANNNDNNACTSSCQLNVCGDGKVHRGVESCDMGSQNGQECSAPYGGTCNYCTLSCQYRTLSGAFCGDGQINGGEFCDGSAVRGVCVTSNVSVQGPEAEMLPGWCVPGGPNACGDGYFCYTDIGVCNGGTNTGKYCIANRPDHCPGGTCVMPTCGPDCRSACPFTTEQTVVLMTHEHASTPVPSVNLYSAGTGVPDGGFLHIPACTVATGLIADVDDAGVVPPRVDIVFVTDMSDSMRSAPGGGSATQPNRRIDIVAQSAQESIDRFVEEFGPTGNVRVGLVSFGTIFNDLATGGTIRPPRGFRVDIPLTNIMDAGGKQSVQAQLAEYSDEQYSASFAPMYNGVEQAISMLNSASPPADRKIIILLSDGGITNNKTTIGNSNSCVPFSYTGGGVSYSDVDACFAETFTELIRPNFPTVSGGIHVYSAALTNNASERGRIAHVSSNVCGNNLTSVNDCQPRAGIQYAYSGATAADVRGMYQSITDSILNPTVAYAVGGQVSGASIAKGRGVPLPFPQGFVCDPNNAQQVPFNISFAGTGTLNISNVRFAYCPAR